MVECWFIVKLLNGWRDYNISSVVLEERGVAAKNSMSLTGVLP